MSSETKVKGIIVVMFTASWSLCNFMFFAKDLDTSNMHQKQVHTANIVLSQNFVIRIFNDKKTSKLFTDKLTLKAIL